MFFKDSRIHGRTVAAISCCKRITLPICCPCLVPCLCPSSFRQVCLPAAITNSGLKYLQRRIKIGFQRRLTLRLHEHLCQHRAYYLASTLGGCAAGRPAVCVVQRVLLAWEGLAVGGVSDEHASLRLPAGTEVAAGCCRLLQVADVVCPSPCCLPAPPACPPPPPTHTCLPAG